MYSPMYTTYQSLDHVWIATLEDVLGSGRLVKGGRGEFLEIDNYHVSLTNPRHRLVWNPIWNSFDPQRPHRLTITISRFVLMMSGNNRVGAFEFYDPNVVNFSDDGRIIPGTAYGSRIYNPLPGFDQVQEIITLLRKDPGTRRAFLPIYQFFDTGRETKDIPCTIGLGFSLRNNALDATVLMRSQNSFGLMPVNVFEFSLLQEVVATELGVELGNLNWHALSMHIYTRNNTDAQKAILSVNEGASMPEMPSNPLKQLEILTRLEEKARVNSGVFAFKPETFYELTDYAQDYINPYWRQFFFVLLIHMTRKAQFQDGLYYLEELLESPWREYIQRQVFDLPATATNSVDSANGMDVNAEFGRIMNEASYKLTKLGSESISPWEYDELRKLFLQNQPLYTRLTAVDIIEALNKLRANPE